MARTPPKGLRPETRVGLAGRDPVRQGGAVNPPVQRATTLVIEDPDDLYGGAKTYALQGMDVHDALSQALVAVEGGAGAVLAPSGLAACTLAILTLAREGGEMLVTDSAYGPTRRFCDRMLRRLGVRTRYYDPRIGADIAALISGDTCGVFLESPGSLTMEVQDIPAIAAAARAAGAATIIDNTWSAGVHFKPFAHGVDLSVQALTKYQGGHADAFGGAVLCATPEWDQRVRMAYRELGLGLGPDDAYLILRGMRSMHARLAQQERAALQIAEWLAGRPEVQRVLHPALDSHPDHALWRRDFSGATGLFSFVLKPTPKEKIAAMLRGLSLFAMGFSWGGFESLIIPCDEQIVRTASSWPAEGSLLRVSIGLEHPDDLIEDLAQGLAALA